MRIILVLLFSIASWGNSVPSVNPKQFSGLWYEIARTYNEYEKKCVASTVEYTLKSTDKYDVTNRCFDSVIGGDLIVYNGKGKTLQPNSASKLELTYFWVFSRQYNLVHWEEQYAIMASPDYQNVWIMSRTPQMPKPKLDELLKKLSLSMNTQKLIFTPQDSKGRYQ